MRHPLALNQWLLAFLVGCAFFAGTGNASPVTIGQSFRLQSSVLKETREYQVAVPADYAESDPNRFPVLYVLDGETHFVHTAAAAAFLEQNGEIPEVIVVGVTSTVRVRDFTQTDWPQVWVGGGGAARFKEFLASELIPTIERRYRTNGFRILSGH